MRVVGDIDIVIVVDELVVSYLPVNGSSCERKQKTNKECGVLESVQCRFFSQSIFLIVLYDQERCGHLYCSG